MLPGEASRTAWGVLQLRASHQLLDAPPHVLDDPVAVRLIDDATRATILDADARERRRADDPRHQATVRALQAQVLIRSRFAEDALADAVDRGVEQFVSLGAGYDTFAYRQPAWASKLRIFEVDEPATQHAKRLLLAERGIAVPDNVRYAAIDFERETLGDGLRRAGFDVQRAAFVSCLGVLVYLGEDAVYTVFRWVASLPRGSDVVATVRQRRNDDGGPMATAVAAGGEPWLSAFDIDELATRLREFGFGDVKIVTGSELDVRYTLRRRDDLHPSRRMTIVTASVT